MNFHSDRWISEGIKAPKYIFSPAKIRRLLARCERMQAQLKERERQLIEDLRASFVRLDTAKTMRSEGATYLEIGAVIGLPKDQVFRLLNPRHKISAGRRGEPVAHPGQSLSNESASDRLAVERET